MYLLPSKILKGFITLEMFWLGGIEQLPAQKEFLKAGIQ